MKKITISALCLLCVAFGFAQLQVGTGTNELQNMPFDPYFGYSYSQSIYTASEINTSGTITEIQYYFSGTSLLPNSQDITVYLGYTTKSEFASNTDWEPVSGLTASYTGGIPVTGPGWISLTLDTPFDYNGTDNLLIAIDENMAGYDSSGDDFWNSPKPVNRSITYRSDSVNPNPTDPPTAAGTYAFAPSIIFTGLVASNPPNCDAMLTSPVDGETSADLAAGITWSAATGSPTGYKVTIGTTTGSNDVADAVDVGNVTTYDFTITSGQTYFVTITPYNNSGDATDCTEESFTGAAIPECPVLTTELDDCGNFDVEITWDAVTDADSYNINVGTTAGGSDIAEDESVTDTSYTFENLVANSTYYVTVTAVNSAGESSGCSEVTYTTSDTSCYCESVPSLIDNNGIGNLQVGSTDFETGGDITYEDFTGTTVDLAQGLNTNVIITFMTNYTYGVNIWIDFNDNFNFEDSELLYTGESGDSNSGTDILDASFVMPATATLGAHRMRIVSDDSVSDATNPCNSSSYGVTMDVDVNIVEATCVPAEATATIVDDCGNSEFSISVDVTELGDGTPVINDGTNTTPITEIGEIVVGPYASGSVISLIIEHGSESTCDLNLGTYTFDCPSVNDDCAGAIDLDAFVNLDSSCTITYTGSIMGATNSSDEVAPSSSCTNNSADPNPSDIWYTLTVPASGGFIYDNIVTPGLSSIVEVYTGSCGALVALDPVNCTSSSSEKTFDGLTPGETVYLRYWDYGSDDEGELEFCIKAIPTDTLDYYNLQAPVSGDIMTGDEFIVYAQAYEAGVTDASDEAVDGIEVWIGYSETDSNPETTTDWTWVMADTNDGFDFSLNNDEYQLDLGDEISDAGTYYYASRFRYNGGPFTYGGIQPNGDGGTWGENGNASGVLTVTAPPAPDNDNIANALAITVDEAFCDGTNNNATNISATPSPEAIGDCFYSTAVNNDVWFTFTVPAGVASVDVSTDFTGGTLVDTEMSVYSGTADNLVELDCSQDEGTTILSNGSSYNSIITDLAVNVGETYYIQVDGYSASTTPGTFCIDVSTNQSLSVSDFDTLGFTYFPNPVSNQLSLKAQAQIETVVIYNMLGQEVINISPRTMDVDVNTNSLENGAYFATVTIGNTSKTIKLIKE